jgi:hypothetical protein
MHRGQPRARGLRPRLEGENWMKLVSSMIRNRKNGSTAYPLGSPIPNYLITFLNSTIFGQEHQTQAFSSGLGQGSNDAIMKNDFQVFKLDPRFKATSGTITRYQTLHSFYPD